MYFKYVSTCIYQYFLSGVRLEVRLSFGFFTAQVVFVSWGGGDSGWDLYAYVPGSYKARAQLDFWLMGLFP